jgi:hypothetical protein
VNETPDKRVESGFKEPKKPYHAPKLEVYGDLRKLTKMISNTNPHDGGQGFTHGTR